MGVDIQNLSFSYGARPVLDRVCFSAVSGELVAVLGPNGVGKSTLFRCMLGLLKTYTGMITLDGADLRALTRPELARRAAYIPQSSQPVFNYTVRETVLMGVTGWLPLLQTPKAEHMARVDETLERLGIASLAERGCGELSGGERQLVLLARALVQDAKTLVMDEPTANLDYGNQSRVMDCARNLALEGYTVIFSTHDPNQALLNATRALVLRDGGVLADGAPEAVLTEELLQDLYGIGVVRRTLPDSGQTVCIPARKEG